MLKNKLIVILTFLLGLSVFNNVNAAEVVSIKLMCLNSSGMFVQKSEKDGCWDGDGHAVVIKTTGSHNNETLNLIYESDNGALGPGEISSVTQKIENLYEPSYQFFRVNLCDAGHNTDVTIQARFNKGAGKSIKVSTWCGD